MTDDAPSLDLMLVSLRSSYVNISEDAIKLLRLVGIDAHPYSNARAADLEESGVDAAIVRSSAGGEAVSEQEVRAFAAVLKEGILQARLALHELHEYDHEVIWEDEVRSAGADKLLGVGPWRAVRRPPPKV